jgi:cytidylate kinase
MEIKHTKGSSKGSGEQEQNSERLAAVNVSREIPFPELPEKMIVAIDGWAQTGKNTSGELVARHLGGVLVDSGRFYRALTAACLEAGVDIGNHEAVSSWCKKAALDVRLAEEGGVAEEAQVAVNGRWFTKEELKQVGLQTSLVAAVPDVRELVNTTLRLCECYGRVVMLGRDIAGVVFPHTPFKFFLDATEEVREQRHVKSTNARGAKKRDIYDQSRVIFTEDSLMIDTSKLEPGEVSGIILVEVFWQSSVLKNNAIAR